MLFALAFIPMFGLGGLTGLPLGLAASDLMLHDTWYVVGHFHYIVAPGTIFAIFAGIYHWFPKVTGRSLNALLGHVHFWGSLVTMNGIFLPMFTVGVRGVNRRLYDGGLQYLHAQSSLPAHAHMTLAALALGFFQLPFVINLAMTLWRGARTAENPWQATTLEWQASSPPPHGNFVEPPRVYRGPYEYSADGHARDFVPQSEATATSIPSSDTPRRGTLTTSVRMGIWLFLASETMLFGSLFSAYALLRGGAAAWPSPDRLDLQHALLMTPILLAATAVLRFGRTATAYAPLIGASVLFSAFVGMKLLDYQEKLDQGLFPSANLLLACWFTLTAVHALHVAGGVAANLWAAWSLGRDQTRDAERLHALRLYWYFVDVIWLVILVSFYLV
jgi:heme/copper-type cytochrome/quinol oxidase subunit 3